MLGLGVAGAWAALEAISAAYHGWPIFCAYHVVEEGYLLYIGRYVRSVSNRK